MYDGIKLIKFKYYDKNNRRYFDDSLKDLIRYKSVI